MRYVAGLAERASLVDHTFRHMCTSKGNAAFHDRPANEFVNLHMCDLVGAQRYYARSEMQMNRSLKGNSLGYYYPLDVPVLGVRVMQCFMRPWHRTTGETGGLMVWIDDVTDKLSLTDPVGDSPVV